MSILNVAGNADLSLFSSTQTVKQQKCIQKFSLYPERMPAEKKEVTDNDKKVAKKFSGLHMVNENPWQQLLQDDSYRLNVAMRNVDLSETIRNICDTADKVSAAPLCAEKTSVTYQMKDGTELSYFTFYEQDKIYCKKLGAEDYEWEIPLENESQYEKVMAFLDSLKEKENQSFTIHNTFWQDFLSGKLNVDEFREYLDTRTQRDLSGGFRISEDGSYFDEDARKYSIYTYGSSFGANIMRTTEELMKWQEKQMAKALEEWEKTHLSWVEQWSKDHPDLAGVKCFLVNGKWYTAEEVDKLNKLMVDELLKET